MDCIVYTQQCILHTGLDSIVYIVAYTVHMTVCVYKTMYNVHYNVHFYIYCTLSTVGPNVFPTSIVFTKPLFPTQHQTQQQFFMSGILTAALSLHCILYHNQLLSNKLYYTVLYCTVLYCTVLYCNV